MIPHILIVDPDGTAARVTQAILSHVVPAATVVVEPTAERGRRRVQAQPPDLLLLDLSPNQLADDRLIREAKALNPRVLVIAFTALASRAALRQLPERQFDGYVAKGSDPETLVQTLREVVGQRFLPQAPLDVGDFDAAS